MESRLAKGDTAFSIAFTRALSFIRLDLFLGRFYIAIGRSRILMALGRFKSMFSVAIVVYGKP